MRLARSASSSRAAAVVMLSEQGRLSLDDPIVRYLPEGSAVWPRVTIRHLLTHTSGIPDDTMPDWQPRLYREPSWCARPPLSLSSSSRETGRATAAPATLCSASSFTG